MRRIFLIVLAGTLMGPLWADGFGTTSGLGLLRIGGTRPSALGDAFSSVENDISALEFNPASLSGLQRGHFSLLHQQGFSDDSFNKAMMGFLVPGGAMGIAVGRYDSGDVSLFDGQSTRNVTAEEDTVLNFGYGGKIGQIGTGFNVRYLSARLAESHSDSAYSLEAGVQIPLFSRFRLGLSGPIYQSNIQFGQQEEDLPQIYRLGLSSNLDLDLATGNLPLLLLMDFPYDADAKEAAFAIGAETNFGPLSLRVGSNSAKDASDFSVGAGFGFSRFNLDYAFGLADSGVNSLHEVSFSMRFGQTAQELEFVRKKGQEQALQDRAILDGVVVSTQTENVKYPTPSQEALQRQSQFKGQAYVVKKGDTLESISSHVYGDESWSAIIFHKNSDRILNPESLSEGVTLTLP